VRCHETSSNRAERFNTCADGATVVRPKGRGAFSADPEARRRRKEVKRQCHGRTSTQAGVIGGGALIRCTTTIYVMWSVIVMSGVAAMVTASAGSVVCA
jgi:hypothetical protein